MNDDEKQSRRPNDDAERGLGRVVYGGDTEPSSAEKPEDAEVVTEASEESFPASDPPNYTVGNRNRSTEPDDE